MCDQILYSKFFGFCCRGKLYFHVMNIDAFFHLQKVENIVGALPGTIEKLCYGTPGFYVNKKFFARIKEDGETLALYNPDRDFWIRKDPEIFFITDHYLNHPMLLVNLKTVPQQQLKELLFIAWEMRASQRLVIAFMPS